MQEHKELFDQLNPGFLLPDKHKLLHHFMILHKDAFTWEVPEQGHF